MHLKFRSVLSIDTLKMWTVDVAHFSVGYFVETIMLGVNDVRKINDGIAACVIGCWVYLALSTIKIGDQSESTISSCRSKTVRSRMFGILGACVRAFMEIALLFPLMWKHGFYQWFPAVSVCVATIGSGCIVYIAVQRRNENVVKPDRELCTIDERFPV